MLDKNNLLIAISTLALSVPPAIALGGAAGAYSVYQREKYALTEQLRAEIETDIRAVLPGVIAKDMEERFQAKIDEAESVRRTELHTELQTALMNFGLELNGIKGDLEQRVQLEQDLLSSWLTLKSNWDEGKITSLAIDLPKVQVKVNELVDDPLSNPDTFNEKLEGIKRKGIYLKDRIMGIQDDWNTLKEKEGLLKWEEGEIEREIDKSIQEYFTN